MEETGEMVQQFPEDQGWFPAHTRDSSQQPTTPVLRDPTATSLPKAPAHMWQTRADTMKYLKQKQQQKSQEAVVASSEHSLSLHSLGSVPSTHTAAHNTSVTFFHQIQIIRLQWQSTLTG